MMNVEKACIADVPQIQRLVNQFADKGEMLPRALSELYENIRDFFVLREGDQLVGCAAHHIFWSDLAEVRAVAVALEKQNQGAGALLVEACLDEARSLGIETVFCLTYRPEFFEKCGFRRVDRGELPRKVWGECLKCPKFPDCDEVALVCKLEPE
jgi:amino-acid N-acetyltransferase